jgi:hypothetical protein
LAAVALEQGKELRIEMRDTLDPTEREGLNPQSWVKPLLVRDGAG